MTLTTRALLMGFLLLATALAGCADQPEEAEEPLADDGAGDDAALDGEEPFEEEPQEDEPGQVGGEPVGLSDDFEGDIEAWTQGSDVPAGDADTATVEVTQADAFSGDQSLRMALQGAQADGTVWLVRPVQLTPGVGYDVQTSVMSRAGATGEGLADALLFVGEQPPASDADFSPENGGGTQMGVRAPIEGETWTNHTLEWAAAAPESGTMYVALGLSGASDAEIEAFFDAFSATFTPK